MNKNMVTKKDYKRDMKRRKTLKEGEKNTLVTIRNSWER